LTPAQRDQSAQPAFTSFPSSFDYDVTSRHGKQVAIRLRLTSGARRVAPGIERDELGSEEETDYATTE